MTTLAEYRDTRDLTVNLVLRELRGRYKRSILGWTWSLLNPLATVIIYWVVFSGFLKVQPPLGDPSGLRSFVLFLLCGLVPYRFVSESMTIATDSLVGNGNLIKKVYFPRELVVIAAVGGLLVTFAIELGVLLVVFLVFGNMVVWWIPMVLVLVVLEACFVLGLGFILAPLNVYVRDVKHFVAISLQALFYSAPIVYPIRLVPHTAEALGMTIPVRDIYSLNPLVPMISCFRAVLYDLRFPPLGDLAYFAGWAVALLFVGHWFFGRLDRRLAEEV
jgi:ABC-type polysaccharide/polyol phosphate export permease